MFRKLFPLSFLLSIACPPPATPSCADADGWSQRASQWPTDALYLGDRPLDQAEAIDLLEREHPQPWERLAAALIVAELNLAFNEEDEASPAVYAAHAWFANRDGAIGSSDEEALALAEALERGTRCP